MKNNSRKNSNIIFVAFSVVLGFLLGWLEGDLTGVQYIGAILSNLGIWIFAGSILAMYSWSSVGAAINVFALFLSKLIAGYAHLTLLSQSVSLRYLIVWVCIAAVGALLGFIVYHARDKGWLGAGCAAVPVSFLIAEGYTFYINWSVPLIFDIVCAIALYCLLARRKDSKLMALPFIIVFTFLIVYFGVLGRVFGGL